MMCTCTAIRDIYLRTVSNGPLGQPLSRYTAHLDSLIDRVILDDRHQAVRLPLLHR